MTDQEKALLTVVARWPRIDGEQALLIVVASLYALAAFTLTFAPDAQLFTQGTRPVFALFPPSAWAVAFLIGSTCSVMLLRRVTGRRQLAAWLTVLPTQAVWLGASLKAVTTTDSGSAMGVVFLTAVLAFTVVTALIVASAWFTRVTAAATAG